MSLQSSHLIARVLGALLLVAFAGSPAAQGSHRDEALGFQVRIPRGWEAIPIRIDEPWIVGKYRAERPERVTEPKSGRTLLHQPEIQMIAFLDEDALPEDAKQTSRTGERYHDYQEYMRAFYTQGFFVEEEETGLHKGIPVTRLTIKAEADHLISEKRVLTWVYELEIGKVAIQTEVMAAALKKHEKNFDRLLRSFRVIPRTKALEVRRLERLSVRELAELTPDERRAHKLEEQEREWERMVAELPEGWTAKEISGIYVLNRTDDRYAKKVVKHVKAVIKWLETTLPDYGRGEYARPPIVRICKDAEEEAAFREGSGSWGVSGTHLVTHEGNRSDSWEWEYISERTLDVWLNERDPELHAVLPAWLKAGLRQTLSAATLKGSKLEFEIGYLEREIFEELPKDVEPMDFSQLMLFSNAEFRSFGERKDWSTWCQAVALTRFLVTARSKQHRRVLQDYLTNLRVVLDDLAEPPTENAAAEAPRNEEEEEALHAQKKQRAAVRERELLERTYRETFDGWSDKRKAGFERAYRRSLP